MGLTLMLEAMKFVGITQDITNRLPTNHRPATDRPPTNHQ